MLLILPPAVLLLKGQEEPRENDEGGRPARGKLSIVIEKETGRVRKLSDVLITGTTSFFSLLEHGLRNRRF